LAIKLLIFGNRGQLATCIKRHSLASRFDIVALGRQEFDLTSRGDLKEVISSIQPELVINTAAFTDVEGAEEARWNCLDVNSQAARHIGELCQQIKIPHIYFSSDYVFNGNKGSPYVETDRPNPINLYGFSKLMGEDAVRETGGVVLRTAWLFSSHENSFTNRILQAAQKHPLLKIVADQVGNPTCADSLAQITLEMSERILSGEDFASLYHVAGNEAATWAELAREAIASAAEAEPSLTLASVQEIDSAQWNYKAPRPHDSRLDTALLKDRFPNVDLSWRASVRRSAQDRSFIGLA
jgi:dTDP-4-dehydrorhamnose reductase